MKKPYILLKSQTVSNIITDNASNMIKAFKISLPGLKTDKNCDSGDDDDDDDNDEVDGAHEVKDEEYFDCLPKHSGCYAHTLQLVVKDG